jgi:tetratricopeptide (TPR) repeat protein
MKTPENIVMMEDHDKAYSAWKERNVREMALVHVDAHIDFGWIPDLDLDEIGSQDKAAGSSSKGPLLLNHYLKSRKKMVNIGNYICPAMREGIVKRFYWVVPDESLHSARGISHILKQLKQILKVKRHAGAKLERQEGCIRCSIFGKEIIVCGLDGLERIEEKALLDIDVDFMLTRSIWDDLNPERIPWISPEKLIEKLAARISDIEVLTIAYSVEGGFTPLRFKYLGNELRSLFQESRSDSGRKIAEYKRKAFVCESKKELPGAIAAYEQVLLLDDNDASAYFALSLLHLNGGPGGPEKAKYYYKQAIRRDKSFSTRYNNYGILYLRYNRLKEAEKEYEKFLGIDADNASVLSGLGYIALARKDYSRAKDFFERSLSADGGPPEARLGKAIVLFKTSRLAEAEELFIGLSNEQPDDAEPFWWLGCIALEKREIDLAIENFKNGVIRGGEGPLVHFLLARLYLTKGLYLRAKEELIRAFQNLRIST